MNLDLIKKLRAATNLSLELCKNALQKSNDNYDLAIEELRKSGDLKASKLVNNSTDEGQIFAFCQEDNKNAALIEVCCQTDFAARSEVFQLHCQILVRGLAQFELMFDSQSMPMKELTSQLGENVLLKRFAQFASQDNRYYFTYRHSNGKVASVIELHSGKFSPELQEFGNNLAMQLAGMPMVQYLSWPEIPEEDRNKQYKILHDLTMDSKKKIPPEKLPAILDGKMNSWYSEVCFLSAMSLLEPKKSILQTIQEMSKKLDTEITVARLVRWER